MMKTYKITANDKGSIERIEDFINGASGKNGDNYTVEPMPSGKFLDTQPEDIDPIDFTHFECWLDYEKEINTPKNAYTAAEILRGWSQNLNLDIEAYFTGLYTASLECVIEDIGIDTAFELAQLVLIKKGYDIYLSDTFIEIYPSRH